MRGAKILGWCTGLTVGLAVLAMPQAAQAWCYIDLDKCVLVDHDGDGFDDETCVDPAQADEGDMVKWQYTVSNTSDWHWDLHYCEIEDPQAQFYYEIPGSIVSPTVANGGPTSVTVTTDAAQCVDLYNVAQVRCDCYQSGVDPTTQKWPANRVSATDDATLSCVPVEVPGLDVEKECYAQSEGYNDVKITIENTGDVDFIDCEVTDPLAAQCEGLTGPIAAHTSKEVTCSIPGLQEDVYNRVSVTCGTGTERLTATASDLCEVREPNFRVRKECDEQYLFERYLTNDFSVYAQNTGASDLTCRITADYLSRGGGFVEIPYCDGDRSGICWECDRTMGSLPVGATAQADCRVYNLPEGGVLNRVEVQCSDGYRRITRTGEDFCEVPRDFDFRVRKVCEPQYYDENFDSVGIGVNEFDVYVLTRSDADLECAITGEALSLDGQNYRPIEECNASIDPASVNGDGFTPCYVCELANGVVEAETDGATLAEAWNCELFGLPRSAYDRVEVTCSDGYTRKTRTGSDFCEVPEKDVCIDRSPGYWATHHDVRNYVIEEYDPEFCGGDDFEAALCDRGSLEFHCAAAALDLAATDILGGSCAEERLDDLEDVFAQCCTGTDGVCGADSDCKDRIDALYDQYEVEFCEDLPDFDGVCNAEGNLCQNGPPSEVRQSKPRLFTPARPEPRVREAPDQLQLRIEMLKERLETRNLRVE